MIFDGESNKRSSVSDGTGGKGATIHKLSQSLLLYSELGGIG